MFKTIITVAGMILFAVFTAITSWPDINLGVPIDSKWITFGSFLIFCIFIGIYMVGENSKLRKSESKLPSISVEPQHFQGSSWYLKVVNNGEKADFSATITFVESTGVGEVYDALWLETRTNEKKLKNGEAGMLQIALVNITSNQEYFVMNGYDTVKQLPKIIRQIEYERFLKRPNMNVQVIISAEPKLRGGKPFIKTYTIGSHLLEESKHQPKRLDGFPLDAIFPSDDGIDIKN